MIVMFKSSFSPSIPGSEDVNRQSSRVSELLTKLSSQAEDLVPKMEDVKAEQMGDLIEDEMEQTTRAIEAAASRIAVSCHSFFSLLNHHSGINLIFQTKYN